MNPTSTWYDLKIRDGDRLITLNGQNVTELSYEHIYSSMMEEKLPLTCQIVWHPELYIKFGENCLMSGLYEFVVDRNSKR